MLGPVLLAHGPRFIYGTFSFLLLRGLVFGWCSKGALCETSAPSARRSISARAGPEEAILETSAGRSGLTWPWSRRVQQQKNSLCAARALTFNEPKSRLSKPSVTKKSVFRLHEALLYFGAQFLKSWQAPPIWVVEPRPGTALLILFFVGHLGLAVGCPKMLRWATLAQDVFKGGQIHPKSCFYRIC